MDWQNAILKQFNIENFIKLIKKYINIQLYYCNYRKNKKVNSKNF